jgi:two-component system chemotaxis sensor kinase CheA
VARTRSSEPNPPSSLPAHFPTRSYGAPDAVHRIPGTVLVAEDSDFFRGQIRRLIEAVGYKVIAAEDGQSAWELLDSHANEVSVVTTDVEMPRLDGLGLTRRIRSDARFSKLPIIALSSLASEEDMARGLAMGVSEYQVKLDQTQLLDSIRKAVHADDGKRPVPAEMAY